MFQGPQYENKIIAYRDWSRVDVALAIVQFDKKEKKSYVAKLLMMEYQDGCIPQPSLHIDPTQAQALMDQLWDCGVRPTEGQGSAGQLAAVRHHLADMRTIAFNKLNIKNDPNPQT